MPATISAIVRLAPVTLRERNRRSGISGSLDPRLAHDEGGQQRDADTRRGTSARDEPSRPR